MGKRFTCKKEKRQKAFMLNILGRITFFLIFYQAI